MRRAGKTAIRRAHNPENQVQLLGLATIFALVDALWRRLGSTRPVRAVSAFLRPGVSRGWPGALLLASGSPLILKHADDELFFEIGMTLSIMAEDGSITEAKTDTFDRRKGRREAFADAWRAA